MKANKLINQLAVQQQLKETFNDLVVDKYPWVKEYIDVSLLESPFYKQTLEKLVFMDQGGFDHGDLSGLYVHFQNAPRYQSTRLFGWKSILEIVTAQISSKSELKDSLIIDFLAGSGTLSKRLKQLLTGQHPIVLGLDVSLKMCEQALNLGEVVLWGNHENHLFKSKSADAVVAAYGFHHVPEKERNSFVSSMENVLKEDGICLLHDFEEGSPSASWYSKVIHAYRSCGHPYQHVTQEGLKSLLRPYFNYMEIKNIYDPFYLEGVKNQDEVSLKREFFAYLISFFNLTKLLPTSLEFGDLKNYENQLYWKRIENLFSPCFKLTKNELKLFNKSNIKINDNNFKCQTVPFVEELTCQALNEERLCLIAPRMALVGIGYKGRRL